MTGRSVSGMGTVISLEARRATRTGTAMGVDSSCPTVEGVGSGDLTALEAAFARLERVASKAPSVTSRRTLGPHAETELLAVIGELALGFLPEATRRLDRLTERLTRAQPATRASRG